MIMDFERSLLRQDIQENGSFTAYMAISLGCHVIMMVCLITVSGFNACERRSFSARVIDVDLVSLPDTDDRPSGSIPKQPEKTLSASSRKAESVPLPKAIAISEKTPTDKVKTSLKEKTFNPGQSVEKAIARLEKQVERQAPSDSVAKAVSRLRQAEQERQQSVTVSGRDGTVGGRSRQELEAIEIYKLEVRYHILRNWVYSSQLAGTDEDLKTVIGIIIAADGRVTDTWFDRRSGNEYYDNSAYKAVLKADPLPSLPEGYKTYTVGLEFTPSDLR